MRERYFGWPRGFDPAVTLRDVASTWLVVGALACAGCASVSLADRTLTGTWVPVDAEIGGAPLPVAQFDGAMLRLTADTYAFGADTGTYWIVADGPPAHMNVQGREGPNAGRVIPAIYRISADRLVICYQLGDGPAPTGFTSPPGSKILLVTYQRRR